MLGFIVFIDLNFFKTFECLLTCIHYNNHNPKKEKNQFLWEIIVSDYDSEQAKENKNSTGLKNFSHNINKRM